jgi:hypothetical protein
MGARKKTEKDSTFFVLRQYIKTNTLHEKWEDHFSNHHTPLGYVMV